MRSALRNVLIYGVVAALALSCLKLLAISPLFVDWGRELAAAVIALVGVVVGITVRERDDSRRKSAYISSRDARDGVATDERTSLLSSPREREVLRLLRRAHLLSDRAFRSPSFFSVKAGVATSRALR